MNVFLKETEEVEKVYVRCRERTGREMRRLEEVEPEVMGMLGGVAGAAAGGSGGGIMGMMGGMFGGNNGGGMMMGMNDAAGAAAGMGDHGSGATNAVTPRDSANVN